MAVKKLENVSNSPSANFSLSLFERAECLLIGFKSLKVAGSSRLSGGFNLLDRQNIIFIFGVNLSELVLVSPG